MAIKMDANVKRLGEKMLSTDNKKFRSFAENVLVGMLVSPANSPPVRASAYCFIKNNEKKIIDPDNIKRISDFRDSENPLHGEIIDEAEKIVD